MESLATVLHLMAFDAFWAAIPAIGFAMIFAVPPRMLPYCALGGAFAHSLRTLLIHTGIPIEWATFLASCAVGFIFILVSKRLLAPRPIFTVASIIPMIPGKFAYNTIIAVLSMNNGMTEKLLQSSIENGLKTLFILFALCFGLALPSLFFYRNKPVV